MTDVSGSGDRAGLTPLDRNAFDRLATAYRRELKVHCYRMMGTLHEADDLVQETFLNAWRARADFSGQGSLRGWLYAIATNSCLNALKARARTGKVLQQLGRAASQGPATGGPLVNGDWLEPYPDAELPEMADLDPGPLARYETREAVQLAFVAAIQLLPPRQRAALLLLDVLGWSAAEAADLLGGTTAAINSALQRARAALAERLPTVGLVPMAEHQSLLDRYMQAWQQGNLENFAALLREDATYTMPPWGEWYQGRSAIQAFFTTVWQRFSAYRPVTIGANAQPAVALYAQTGDNPIWRAHSLHILTPAADGAIASLTVYVAPLGPSLFAAFGLKPQLHA